MSRYVIEIKTLREANRRLREERDEYSSTCENLKMEIDRLNLHIEKPETKK